MHLYFLSAEIQKLPKYGKKNDDISRKSCHANLTNKNFQITHFQQLKNNPSLSGPKRASRSCFVVAFRWVSNFFSRWLVVYSGTFHFIILYHFQGLEIKHFTFSQRILDLGEPYEEIRMPGLLKIVLQKITHIYPLVYVLKVTYALVINISFRTVLRVKFFSLLSTESYSRLIPLAWN